MRSRRRLQAPAIAAIVGTRQARARRARADPLLVGDRVLGRGEGPELADIRPAANALSRPR
jgi:hypothetical protein